MGPADERANHATPSTQLNIPVEQGGQPTPDSTRLPRTSEFIEKSGEDARSNSDYVTKDELIRLLKAERNKIPSGLTTIDFHPPYPMEIATKPYPRGYVSLAFRKYN